MIRRALLLAWLGATAGATPGAEGNDLPSNRELLYRVGPGDVLEVVVDGRPDLSRLPTVQTTGTIHHPLLGDVPVADLSVADVLTRVATLLAKEGSPIRCVCACASTTAGPSSWPARLRDPGARP